MFIEQFPRIIDMRRNLVQMQAKFPEELLNLFENMEQRSNPWGIAPVDRAKWAAGIDVKPFETGNTEYLFYVGCAGAFDARDREVTLAIAKILDAAGISWGIRTNILRPCVHFSFRKIRDGLLVCICFALKWDSAICSRAV